MSSPVRSPHAHSASTPCQESSGNAMRIFLSSGSDVTMEDSCMQYYLRIFNLKVVFVWDFWVLCSFLCFGYSIGRLPGRCLRCCPHHSPSLARGRYSPYWALLRSLLCLRRVADPYLIIFRVDMTPRRIVPHHQFTN